MQVLLQLVCVVCFVGSPSGGFLSPPHLAGRCLCSSVRQPRGYSVAICSMWSLSSLYCSGKEREKGSGRLLSGAIPAPSLQEPGKGLHIPRDSPPTFIQVADGRLLLQEIAAEFLVEAERQHVVDEGAEGGQRCSE